MRAVIRFTKVVLMGVLALAAPAQAGIVGVTGSVVEWSSAPADVTVGALESNTEIGVFAERSGVVLGSDLAVDLASPGTYTHFNDLPGGTPVLAAGQKVDSYLLHFDTLGTNTATLAGSVSFDRDVVGLFIYTATLDATDAQFAAPGTLYGTHRYRGLEGFSRAGEAPQDAFTLTSDSSPRELALNFKASTAIDQVRVLTVSAVPLPAPILLLASAGLLLIGWRRAGKASA